MVIKKQTKSGTVKGQLDLSQTIIKARFFCVYQERHQQEVRDKIYGWGLHSNEVESIIAELISNDFINEERYAKTFAGGKFRIKKWGKVKIRIELKKKNITNYCINKALEEIPEIEYSKTIKTVIFEKINTANGKNDFEKKFKTGKYLISRGFESELVWAELNRIKVG